MKFSNLLVLLFVIGVLGVISKQNSPVGSLKSGKLSSKLKKSSGSNKNNKGDIDNASKKKKKIPQRKIILPSKKEPIATKALRAMNVFSKSVMTTAETVIATSQKAKRDLKAYFSSDFETLLLKLTRPDDERPSEEDVCNMMFTIESFSRNMDLTDEANPYRITLHKLWVKAAEADPRTVLKSLFLLHCVLKTAEPEDAVIFRGLMLKMSKELCTKTQCLYFDFDSLQKNRSTPSSSSTKSKGTVGRAGKVKKAQPGLTQRYASFCLKRGRAVTSGFEELRLVGLGMRAEDICAQFLKAMKLIDAILECKPLPGEECEAALPCLELLAKDLREVFELFHEKLIWLRQEQKEGGGALFEGWAEAEVQAVMNRFKSFHNTRLEDVQSFLADVGNTLELYGVNMPTAIDASPILE